MEETVQCTSPLTEGLGRPLTLPALPDYLGSTVILIAGTLSFLNIALNNSPYGELRPVGELARVVREEVERGSLRADRQRRLQEEQEVHFRDFRTRE